MDQLRRMLLKQVLGWITALDLDKMVGGKLNSPVYVQLS